MIKYFNMVEGTSPDEQRRSKKGFLNVKHISYFWDENGCVGIQTIHGNLLYVRGTIEQVRTIYERYN